MSIAILDFSVELYNEDGLFSVEQCLGKPLKLDMNTYWTTKGKYAHLCVEIEILKPAVSKVYVNG